VSGVAADSMGVRKIGSIAFDVAQREHAVVSLISDQEIIDAEAALWDVCRVAAEPGGAAALAAVRAGALRPESGEAVVVLVCGGNVESLPSAAQPSNISPGHPRAGVRRA
jgi:threonine dehydratase